MELVDVKEAVFDDWASYNYTMLKCTVFRSWRLIIANTGAPHNGRIYYFYIGWPKVVVKMFERSTESGLMFKASYLADELLQPLIRGSNRQK